MGTLYDDDTKTELEYVDVSFTMPYGNVVGRWYGSQKVRPLLALHGWLDNMGTWNKLLPLLPKHLGVLCIDLPGHGYSTRMPDGMVYHSFEYLNVVKHIMDEYQWTKVSILAHSMSAMISYVFASIFPEHVDMFISIDVIRPPNWPSKMYIDYIKHNVDKLLVENDRMAMAGMKEPPSYSLTELQSVTHKGSRNSVAIANSHHIYERNVKKSEQYPDKYYFSRDARLKFYFPFMVDDELAATLAKRLVKVPFCVIKGSLSSYINEKSTFLVDIMRRNNPNFELHEVEGTHHVHLNNAVEVAEIINPFICRHRPPMLETWSVGDDPDLRTEKKPWRRNLRWRLKRSKL